MMKEVRNLLIKNCNQILKFEFFFKIFTLLIAVPLFLNIFKMIMKVTGYNYLMFENISSFLINPVTLVMLLLFLLIIGFYSIFDIGTIIILLDASKQDKEMSLKSAIELSFKKSLKIFHPQNFGLLVFVLFLIPFLNLGIGSSVISSIKVPEFIMDFIINNQPLNFLYFILVTLLIVLSLKWLYLLHYYFLENKSFREAHKCSKRLSHKKHLKDVLAFSFMQGVIMICYLLFITLGIIGIVLFDRFFDGVIILESVLISIIIGFIFISLIIFSIINRAISYACLSVLFYRHKEKSNERIEHIALAKEEKKSKNEKWNILKYAFIILGLLGLTIFTQGVIKGNFKLNIEYVRNMEITAHRGASTIYPENTMAAFVGAKELGADWIELDVQQTKDYQIIVSHDINFKRVAGVDINSYEATYEEILKLDIGSFKNSKFKDEKVPLLEEVIKWAKDNHMKLNIELKPTGHENSFEQQVVDIIKKYHFEKDCVITSQVYEVLTNVKKIDKDITTVYVMSFAFGNITELDSSDYFSVEATSITKEMVSKIHKEGKQIYGWTVNTEEGINKMIKLNVDNIITDDISLGKELVAKSKSSDLITEIINFIQTIFG